MFSTGTFFFFLKIFVPGGLPRGRAHRLGGLSYVN